MDNKQKIWTGILAAGIVITTIASVVMMSDLFDDGCCLCNDKESKS